MDERDSELQPIIGERQSYFFKSDRLCTWFSKSKWLLFLTILLGQLIGVILFMIWAVDCLFREFHTFANCKHFHAFPMPKMFECFWLFSSCAGSIFLIYHVVYLSQAFCGVRVVIRRLVKKKYFYKICFVLLVIVVYVVYVMSNNPEEWTTIAYMLFITEKFLTVILMFLLNFLPRFWNNGESRFKQWLYKAALGTYSVQNFLVALYGSTIAAYQVLTIPDPQPKVNETQHPGAKSVVDLMLLITNNGFRYFVAEFFLSKMFDEELDILGGKTIQERIGTTDYEGQDEQDDIWQFA